MVRAFVVLAALLVLALAQAGIAAEGHLTGTVAFRDIGPVPADAVLQVLLADVSRGTTGTARALGEATLARPDGPPYAFDIAYDTADVKPEGTYVLRAELSSGGQVLYRSRGLLPVLTRGASSDATLWLAQVDPAEVATAGLDLPVTFEGAIRCKDCRDVRYQLNLWPNRVFQLRRTWEGKDMRRDAIGLWSVDATSRTLTLHGGEDDLAFEVLGHDRLRVMVPRGAAPAGDGVLAASPAFEPFEPQLAMRGLVTWADNRLSLVECLTGRQYPVVGEGDYDALQHAYLAAGAEPDVPLMASFDGTILQGQHPEAGPGAVRIDRFVGVWPGETCARASSPATLRNTYWRLLRLGDADVAASPNRREPSLILREGERRFSATVGCNPLTGRFTLDDGHLHFGQITGPRLDCPAALDALEDQLVSALTATAAWRITGQSLELYDLDGDRVALLQAVYLY
ncbi:MAG: META domain-containing protein [Amaricoccus sp.]|uniref:META domain-containing protein n=1 Tax=Amaricoccus sp. TaxID=1872485 RepID=UPI0039E371B1